MRKIVLVIILVFSTGIITQLHSQDFIVKHGSEYMLPSSEAIAGIKHIARPPGLSTGIPEISIPLWNNGMCRYGINLNYYAGGIQVNELASSVGLGWSLDAGGAITRVVNGLPDDLANKGYLYAPASIKSLYTKGVTMYDDDDASDLNSLGEAYDTAPDIFYYNFNGIKGKFVFKDTFNIVTIPQSNLEITPGFSGTGEISFFLIKTADGVMYRFYIPERVTINSYRGILGLDSSSDLYLGYTSYNSAWHIASSLKISKGDAFYKYNTVSETFDRKLYEFRYYNETETEVHDTIWANITIERPQLRSISDANSIAEFSYGTDNELESIKISGVEPSDADLEISKILDVKFNYSEFISSSSNKERKRKLISVKMGRIPDSGLEDMLDEYKFTYFSSDIPSEFSKEQDLWGYYNANNETSLLPRLRYATDYYECLGLDTLLSVSGVIRDVIPTVIQKGMLTEIENPKGGITEYTYEPQAFSYYNQQAQENQTTLGGGLRIKKITYKDTTSDFPDNIVNYTYTQNNNPSLTTGVLLSKPNFAYNLDYHQEINKQSYHYANLNHGLSVPFGNPIYYSQVTVDNDGLGYSVKDFDLPIPKNVFLGLNLNFDSVTSLNPVISTSNSIISYLGNEYIDNYCYGLTKTYLTRERIFDASEKLLNETIYHYKDIEDLELVEGFFISPNLTYPISQTSNDLSILKKFYYPTSWKLLEETETNNYIETETDTVTDIFSYSTLYDYYEYFDHYRFLKETQTTDVKGYTHYKEIIYPFNYHLDQYTTNPDFLYYMWEIDSILSNDDYVNFLYEGSSFEDDPFILNKGIDSDSLPEKPTIIDDADPNVLALASMLDRGQLSTPIEIIESIKFNDDVREITSASFKTFRISLNESIVLDKEYIIQGPIDYNESDISGESIDQGELVFNSNYQLVSTNGIFNKFGELLQKTDASGVTTAFQWYKYGNYLKSKTVNSTYTESYEYKPLIGKTSETDMNGNKTYYLYDIQGRLVAKKDNEKNIREIISYNTANKTGVQEIDESTDPDGVYSYSTDPIATLSAFNNKGGFLIIAYNPVFEYQINFGDASAPEIVNQSYIEHSYSQSGNYTIEMEEKKNGFIVNKSVLNLDITVEVAQ
jgi:YD repeat-containing protein